jgi:flavin reductase (DIM6/NTAB) family NADH-FMN oxidoreductase RutF
MQQQKKQSVHSAALDASAPDAAPLNVGELRRALGSFATGVAVATTLDSGGKPKGFTANSFTSVSLDPPLVLVCVDKAASCYPAFAGTHHFGINILSHGQQHVSKAFASKLADKFEGMPWVSGVTGSPIFPDSAAWLDCKLHQRIEAGDHLILIGEVLDFGHAPTQPALGYHRGGYIAFGVEG